MQLKKKIGDPNIDFYGLGIGILLNESPPYIDEIYLEEKMYNNLTISKYNRNNIDIFLFGTLVNSNDPLLVIINGNPIYNKKPRREVTNFYESTYIEKLFTINIEEHLKNGRNNLEIYSGGYSEIFGVDIK